MEERREAARPSESAGRAGHRRDDADSIARRTELGGWVMGAMVALMLGAPMLMEVI